MPSFSRPAGTTRFQERSQAKLGLPSAWLDGEYNHIIDILNEQGTWTQNISEWALCQVTPIFVSNTQFTVSGDLTDVFLQTRRIRANLNGTYAYSEVSSASYDAPTNKTTVTLKDAILTASLTQIYYGLVSPLQSGKSSLSPAALGSWITKTATYTAVRYDMILADTQTTGAFTVTLPASPTAGDWVRIRDAKGYFATNNLTVARNGSNIRGVAADLTLDVNGTEITLVYVDATTGWMY